MSRLDGWRHRLSVLLKGDAYDEEIRRELRFHRELDAVAQRASLGNETYHREEVRRMTLLSWSDRIRQDAIYAYRGLRRTPGFTAAVVLTLGLGVGVNGAMFSLLSRMFIVPPDGVARASEVRRLYATFNNGPTERITSPVVQYPQFAAMRAAIDRSIALGISNGPDSTSVRDGDRRIPTMVDHVNSEFFAVLGVAAERGRVLVADEDRIDTPTPVAVLSDAYWRRAFNADPSVLGRRVRIGTSTFTVVGVAGRNFTGIDVSATDVWLPANTYGGSGHYNNVPWYRACCASFRVIARPRSRADERQIVTAGTNAVQAVRVPGWIYDSTIAIESGPVIAALGPATASAETVVANRIAGVVLFVLIIAGANIMNLLLLRTARRRREIAVRRALGVSRARLFEQIAVEAFILALGGAIVATVGAFWAGTALRRLILPRVHWAHAVLDGRTIWFILAASIIVAVLSAVAPSLEAMRVELTAALKAGSQQGGYQGSRLRAALLVVQTALCVVLLVGAGLFLTSLNNVASIDSGFDSDDRLFINAAFDDDPAHQGELRTAIPEAAARLRGVDGVSSVAFAPYGPIAGYSMHPLFLPGHDKLPRLPGGDGMPSLAPVSTDYLKTVGVRLLAGRDFSSDDVAGGAPVMIVSRRLAQLYWPGENPLGKCIMIDRRDAPCTRVVGVASDTHRMSLIERPTTQMYVPIAQTAEVPRMITVHVRPGHAAAVARAADQILRSRITDLVATRTQDFADLTRRELHPWRLGATLFTALGILALVVAAVGVYSVVAYGVSQRGHEMGVRIALGARRSDILDLVLGEALRTTAGGILLGVVVALLLARFIASLLFGVTPDDPSVILIASVTLSVVSSIATLVPAWRASSVNPVTALRAD